MYYYCVVLYDIKACTIVNPIILMLLVMFMFLKGLFFIRIFEKFGFLVMMIKRCLIDLVPFICCFILFVLLFSTCLIILNNEVDTEIDEV